MSMESATTILADSPEQRSMKSIFGSTAATDAPPADNDARAFNSPESPSTGSQPAAGSPSAESPVTVPMRDRDRTERFARDINTKIDALEEQMTRSTSLMERSQEMVRQALDELRDRIKGVSKDAEQQLARQQSDIDTQRQAIDFHQSSVTAQQEALAQHEQALQKHDANLRTHTDKLDHQQAHISSHTRQLEQQQTALHTQEEQLRTLDIQQAEMHQSLVGLAQEHDAIAGKVDVLADQVSDTHVELGIQRQHTQRQVRNLTGALVGSSVLSLALIGYFTLHPVATTESVNSQLQSLSNDMTEQRSTTSSLKGDLQRLDGTLAGLQGDIAQLQGNQSTLLSGQQGQHEEIGKIRGQLGKLESTLASLRTRLQQRLGGNAKTAASPALKLHDSRWLASRPSGHYVIQLAGTRDQSSLARLVNNNVSTLGKQPLSVASTQRDGQTWHHLMYGDFATRSEAQAALARLPSTLQQAKPWVRQIGSVVKTTH